MKLPVILTFVVGGVLVGWWLGIEGVGARLLRGDAAPALPVRSSEEALQEAWSNERRILEEFQALAADKTLTESKLTTVSAVSAEAVTLFIDRLLELDQQAAETFVDGFREDPALAEFEGESHAIIVDALGSAYATLGLPTKAEPLLRMAAEERRSRLGLDHAQTQRSLQRWAETLLALGRREEARGIIEELLGATQEDDPAYSARRALLE